MEHTEATAIITGKALPIQSQKGALRDFMEDYIDPKEREYILRLSHTGVCGGGMWRWRDVEETMVYLGSGLCKFLLSASVCLSTKCYIWFLEHQ